MSPFFWNYYAQGRRLLTVHCSGPRIALSSVKVYESHTELAAKARRPEVAIPRVSNRTHVMSAYTWAPRPPAESAN